MHTLISLTRFPYAASTVDLGYAISSAFNSDISLLTVATTNSDSDNATNSLKTAGERLPIEPIASLLKDGDPESQIMMEIRTGQYDLLVIGARHHRGSPAEVLLGDVSHRVVKRTPISTLVVRGESRPLQNILVCTGGPEAASDTVTSAATLARTTGSRVTLLHVAAAIPTMYTGLEQIGETLTDLLQTDTPTARHLRQCAQIMESNEVEANIELRHGIPATEIIRSVERGSFDLLIIGASAHRGLGRVLLDEVSLKLVDRSTLPLLIIQKGFEESVNAADV